jgi:transketolase
MPQQIVNRMKRQIALAAHAAGEGHVASAYSILDILWVLHDRVLEARGTTPDRFILSKGHASLALYAVLAQQQQLAPALLDGFCGYASPLGGHPDCRKAPGVVASTGSLGHGLPIAVGMALGRRIRAQAGRVYCLVGDGECNEGSIWEAALLAGHHRLANLTCIVDFNHSTDRALDLGDLAQKFQAFGWETVCASGHDAEQIQQALMRRHDERPVAYIAATTKGAGVRIMENNPAWHHRAPDSRELQAILAELA